jgi:hypothetical protein
MPVAQILGQAFGGKTFKLKFGHHGGNHPIRAPTGQLHTRNSLLQTIAQLWQLQPLLVVSVLRWFTCCLLFIIPRLNETVGAEYHRRLGACVLAPACNLPACILLFTALFALVGGGAVVTPSWHSDSHPCSMPVPAGKIEVSAQNHNFAVDPDTLPKGVEVSHINLNDGTCAGGPLHCQLLADHAETPCCACFHEGMRVTVWRPTEGAEGPGRALGRTSRVWSALFVVASPEAPATPLGSDRTELCLVFAPRCRDCMQAWCGRRRRR